MMIYEHIKEMLRNSTKSPEMVADDLQCSLSTLYKYAESPADSENPDASGRAMPSTKIIPLTHATEDNQLIEHFAEEIGMALTNIEQIPMEKLKTELYQLAQRAIKYLAKLDKKETEEREK